MKKYTLFVGLLVLVLLFLVMRSSRYETPDVTTPAPTPTLTASEKVTDILQRINGLIMPM